VIVGVFVFACVHISALLKFCLKAYFFKLRSCAVVGFVGQVARCNLFWGAERELAESRKFDFRSSLYQTVVDKETRFVSFQLTFG